MYSSEYAARPDVLCWLMAASGVTYAYVFLGTALNALRTFRVRVPLHLVTLITLAGLCAALGRRHGLAGVTWAICMTEALAAMFYAGVVLARSRRVASSQATVP
jgi:O-antigen/teichoic acid export membrane protein